MRWARQFEVSQKDAKVHSLNPYSKSFIEEQWVQLFVDGAMKRYTGKAATGGVIRDEDNNWVLGFNHFLGTCTPFEVELWGFHDGMLLMLEKGYKRGKILMDNLDVVKALSENEMKDMGITIL